MRDGISLYKWSVLISALLSTAVLVFLVYQATTGGSSVSIPQGGSPGSHLNNTIGVSLNPGAVALQAGEDIAGLAAFIITVLSWSRWRTGIKQVDQTVGEYGPEHQLAAHRAKGDYDKTLWMFIIILIVGFVGVFAIALDLVANQLSNNGATTNLSSAFAAILTAVLVLVAVLLMLNFLMYFFSSRSLRDTFYALANGDERTKLDRARRWVLAGAAIPLAGGIFLFVGMVRFQEAYDAWLNRSH